MAQIPVGAAQAALAAAPRAAARQPVAAARQPVAAAAPQKPKPKQTDEAGVLYAWAKDRRRVVLHLRGGEVMTGYLYGIARYTYTIQPHSPEGGPDEAQVVQKHAVEWLALE